MKKITVEIQEETYMKLLEIQLMLKRSTAARTTLAAAIDWTVKQLPADTHYKPAIPSANPAPHP